MRTKPEGAGVAASSPAPESFSVVISSVKDMMVSYTVGVLQKVGGVGVDGSILRTRKEKVWTKK